MTNLTCTRKPRLLLLFLAVAVGVVAFACWPRGPRLEWYTSPPLYQQDATLRFRALVPAGWQIVRPTSRGVFDSVGMKPPDRFTWLPGRLRSLVAKEEPNAVIAFSHGARPSHNDDGIHVQERHSSLGSYWVATRQSGPKCSLTYLRSSKAEFDATYRQICQSFRVVR